MVLEATVPQNVVPTLPEKLAAAAAAAGVELVDLGSPILADVDRIVTAIQIADGAQSLAAQPDVPRNITGTLTDADDSVAAVVTIVGKDLAGVQVEEVMTISLGTGKVFVGTKIFAVVDSVTVGGTSGSVAGDNLTIGVGDLIGLPKSIVAPTAIKHTWLNAVPVTPDAIATGPSTSGVDANGATYDGTKIMRVAYRPGE